MRRILTAALASVAMFAATPAMASITINPDGSITTGGTGGGSATINLNGLTDGPTLVPGLSAVLTLTFNSLTNNNTSYVFGYSLFNSSSAPITASTISSFGFDTNANVTGGSATGDLNVLRLGETYPIVANPDVCLFNPNGPDSSGVCTGSGGGIDIGQTGTGTLTLNLGTGQSSITLSNFVDRYQAIAGVRGLSSAVGEQTPAVPEAATWAMMLLGFGGIGMAMRRRRKSGLAQIA